MTTASKTMKAEACIHLPCVGDTLGECYSDYMKKWSWCLCEGWKSGEDYIVSLSNGKSHFEKYKNAEWYFKTQKQLIWFLLHNS